MELQLRSKSTNFIIMMPSFVVFAYVIGILLQNMVAVIWIPLFALPFVKLLLPKQLKAFVYRFAIVIILILFLYAELSLSGLIGSFADTSLFPDLITFSVILSFEISIAFILLIEGTMTNRPGKAISYMFLSFFLLAEQLSAVYLYNSPMFPVYYNELLPYLHSFPLIPASNFQFAYEINFIMQYYALYTLLFMGAEGVPLPLTVITNSYDYVILVAFVMSFIAISIHFYLSGEKDQKYRLPGAALSSISGILIAFVTLVLMRVFQVINYQFLILSIIIASFWIAAARIVRKASRSEITNI